MTTTTRPLILEDSTTIDPLATFEAVEVQAKKLREGMVVLDTDLLTPAFFLDHKNASARRSGSVTWFAHDLENGGFTEVVRHENKMVLVAAR